ncbi:MAG TPA: hypothetical protein P5077_00350 [bacterium]|nr:hypothetical protein [bacterium]
MLKPSDRHHALKTMRKHHFSKSRFGYKGSGIGFFRQHRSYSCGHPGCFCCTYEAVLKRKKIKNTRVASRKIIDRELAEAKG